jgi:pyruvate kinase
VSREVGRQVGILQDLCDPKMRRDARLRRELQARSCRARIVIKIEKPQAVQNLDANRRP